MGYGLKDWAFPFILLAKLRKKNELHPMCGFVFQYVGLISQADSPHFAPGKTIRQTDFCNNMPAGTNNIIKEY